MRAVRSSIGVVQQWRLVLLPVVQRLCPALRLFDAPASAVSVEISIVSIVSRQKREVLEANGTR